METEDADMENQAGASSPSRVSTTCKNQFLVTSSGGGGTGMQIEVRLRWVIYLPHAKKPVSSDVVRRGRGHREANRSWVTVGDLSTTCKKNQFLVTSSEGGGV